MINEQNLEIKLSTKELNVFYKICESVNRTVKPLKDLDAFADFFINELTKTLTFTHETTKEWNHYENRYDIFEFTALCVNGHLVTLLSLEQVYVPVKFKRDVLETIFNTINKLERLKNDN